MRNTYCRIRDIHTSPKEDCKKPEAITTEDTQTYCCHAVSSQPLSLYVVEQVKRWAVRGQTNKKEQSFILSHLSHLGLYKAREWTETQLTPAELSVQTKPGGQKRLGLVGCAESCSCFETELPQPNCSWTLTMNVPLRKKKVKKKKKELTGGQSAGYMSKLGADTWANYAKILAFIFYLWTL